jgi:predicted ATP-grasp superfamily ATP-dependent carboligase
MSRKKKPGIILGTSREIDMFAIIKSFVKRRIEVIVFDPDPKAPGFFMPGISGKFTSPDPEINPEEFAKFMIEIGRRYPGNVLLVNEDRHSQLIAEYRNEFSGNLLFLTPGASINSICSDKANTAEALAEYGIPSPQTYFFSNDQDDFKHIDVDFPLLLKPRKSAGSQGQYIVKNREELSKSLRIINDKKSEYIIQEWIPGSVENLCNLLTIFDEDSQPKAIFTARKLNLLRTSKIDYGIATYFVSEHISDIIESGIDFLKKIKWQGLAELEFKFDERDNKFKLFEVNPRAWAWMKMPMRCGVDFPKIYYDLLCGKNVEPVFNFRTGVTYLRSVIDAYSSFYKLFTGDVKLTSLSNDLIRKYSKIVFNPKDNIVDELPWIRPNLRWIFFYLKRLKEYG